MRWRFTLTHELNAEDIQFENNSFDVSLSGWDQIGGGSEIAFSWNNPSSARASGAAPNTAGIGQTRPDNTALGWPAGTYIIAITATNTSTGGSAPLQSLLNIYGSDTGATFDDAFVYTGTGTWDVGAGTVTREVTFTLPENHYELFFKFTKVGPTTGYNVQFTVDLIELIRVENAGDPNEISEPDGWKGAKIRLERDKDYFDLNEYYDGASEGAFIFYGDNDIVNGGIAILKDLEETFGLDVNVGFLAEFAPDDDTYIQLFSGLLDISGKNEMKDNKMQVPVIRDDFWAKFMSRQNTPMNLSSLVDIDGNAVDPVVPINITLTDQFINQYFVGFLPVSTYSFNAGLTPNGYIQIDFDDTNEFLSESQKAETIDEVKDHVTAYPIIDNPSQPSPSFDFEFPGDVVVNNLTIIARHLTGDTVSHLDADIKGYLFDGVTEHLLTRTDYFGSDGTTRRSRFIYSGTITDVKSIAVYLKNDSGSISDDIGLLFDDQVEIGVPPTYITKFDFYLISKFTATPAEGYLIHDLIHGVLARMGLGSDPFRSDFFGSTLTNSHQYAEDGCGWMYGIFKGLQIRQYTLTEKPFFISFREIWEGINPILNLGLGYDLSGDSPDHQIIRIEQKAFFVDDAISINFSNVRDISSSYDQDMIFKSIMVGYKKWQSEDISGIDDPQTKHTYATRFTKVGKDLPLDSGFIAAGLAIETTRRANRKKSADYKYDNESFIIALNPSDVSPDFTPELSDNFDSVSNVQNSDKRYNLILTPLRNFLRWANYIGGCLQSYTSSSYKFVSAEGNYDMVSDYSCSTGNECQAILCNSLSEKQDIPLGAPDNFNTVFGYFFVPLIYDIVIPMEWEEYETIRDNRRMSIGISQTDTGHVPFKIKLLEYDIIKGQASVKAWPKTFFRINVIESVPENSICYNSSDSGNNFDADYQAVLDKGTALGYSLPSDAQQILQNQLVLDLKAAGIWGDLDILYVMATDGDSNFATLNWINPNIFQLTKVNSPSHTPNIGFFGTGTEYLNTGWTPSTDGVNFSLDDASAFCYNDNDLASGGNLASFGCRGNGGGASNGGTLLLPKNSFNTHSLAVNSNAANRGTATVTADGFFQVLRVSSAGERIFKNGSQVGTDTSTIEHSSSNKQMYILALNGNGTPTFHSTLKVGVFGAGASLSGKETDLYNAWNDYFSNL